MGKFAQGVKAIVNKLLKTKTKFDIPQQCFALLPQVNFPANNLYFTEGEGDGIEFRLPIFSTLQEFTLEKQMASNIKSFCHKINRK